MEKNVWKVGSMTDVEFECGCVMNVFCYMDDVFKQYICYVEESGNEICPKHIKQVINEDEKRVEELHKWGREHK